MSKSVVRPTERPPIEVVTRGDVPEAARQYAVEQLGRAIDQIAEPVLFVRVKLTQAPDPARDRPAIAEVSVDVNGDVVRAQLAGHDPREAIDLLQRRLRSRLEHRAERQEAVRQRPASSGVGEWRHGDPPTHRPEHFDRPVDERELVRRSTYTDAPMTPDEAAFDLEQLDVDFYLFRELATGEDALIERDDGEGYRLTRLGGSTADPGPTAVRLTVVGNGVPVLTVDEARERLDAGGERLVLFADAATGRANVLYLRYDGHYGLVAPAAG